MFCLRCRPATPLVSVSSPAGWSYWTLLEPRVAEARGQPARQDLAEEDPLPPPALQLQAQLWAAAGPRPDLNVVDLHRAGLLLAVDVDVHGGPGGALRGHGLAGLAGGDGDDGLSERLPSPGPDNPLGDDVAL